MNKKKRTKLIFIIISIILVLIFVLYIFFSNKQKSIMYCYKEANLHNGIKQTMSYELFRSNNTVKIKENVKIILSDEINKQLILKGYNLSVLEDLFRKSIEKYFSQKISNEIKNYTTYNFYIENETIYIDAEYIIDKKNKDGFTKFFKIDFYSSKQPEILKYFEGGKMKCEIN